MPHLLKWAAVGIVAFAAVLIFGSSGSAKPTTTGGSGTSHRQHVTTYPNGGGDGPP